MKNWEMKYPNINTLTDYVTLIRRQSHDPMTIPSVPPTITPGVAIQTQATDNHVYLYDDITPTSWLALWREIRELDITQRGEALARDMTALPSIYLHINSNGGDLFTSLAAYDQLASLSSPTISIIEGVAASGASLIALACAKRTMRANSFVMIHQLSTMMYGTHEEFKDDLEFQNKAMENLTAIYASRSKLEADKVRELLKRNTWFNAQECLANGLVDALV